MNKIKLSTYAKRNDICYRTAYNHYKKGLIKGIQLKTGTILIYDEDNVKENSKEK